MHQFTQKNITVKNFNLAATLISGQAFCWRPVKEGGWQGWIGSSCYTVSQERDVLTVESSELDWEAVEKYFQLQIPLSEILNSFPDDIWLKKAQEFAPGLRILRQDPWETTVNFICSSLKQIVQIQQINGNLRRRFGSQKEPGLWSFPSIEDLRDVTEMDLRECKLGFRARHLYRAIQQISSGEICLDKINGLPTDEARVELLRIAGVGEKIANCILLFAYGRMEAFPIDVWVERVLRELYFSKKRRVDRDRLKDFAKTYFGPNAGYAQQYLFHWMRNKPKEV
jgi:N-glycosylase/DNA lyase